MKEAGYKYASHSFRYRAATAAGKGSIQGSLIKTLGHWESSAYTNYIKIPPETLYKVSSFIKTEQDQMLRELWI